MPLAVRWTRLLIVISAVGLAGAAFAIRAVLDRPVERYSGAA